MKNIELHHEQLKPPSLVEVPAIERSRNHMIIKRDQIKDFVE